MAKVPVDTSVIKDSLADLLKKTADALVWVPIKKEIELEIPEPFDHPVREHKPAATSPPCLIGPSLEECADIGILMGVLNAMTKPGKKPSRPKGKHRSGK